LVESGQLGIFAAHWWDHPDYKLLPPEVHLIGIAHYLNMLDVQREFFIPQVVFGGKNPHPHYIVGGMNCSISLDDMNAPVNAERLAVVEDAIYTQVEAVNLFYLVDLLAIGHIYVQKGQTYGGGLAKKRVIGYGEFPDEPYKGIKTGDYHNKILYHSNGVVEDFELGVDKAKYYPLVGKDFADSEVIQEYVTHSWYKYPDEKKGLHPWDGITEPNYTGPKEGTKTHWKYLDERGKYSWIKSPRWKGKPCEVGPLARYIIVYTWDPSTWPKEARGIGLTEAPRGALGHWVIIKDGKIANYQCVVPTTWNGSPGDPMGGQGAFEECMKDTPVRVVDKPLEVLRGIHSFDPCLACSTHIYNAKGEEITSVKVQGSVPICYTGG